MQTDIDKPSSNDSEDSKPYNVYQVMIPVLLGLIVIGWLFLKEFDPKVISTFTFTYKSLLFILLAFFLMLLRDFGMIWRFRLITDNDLTWKQAFHVNVLSEFTTAVTPPAVGGSSLVVLFLMKEGINAGRSTTIMFVNLFLDELFFLVGCPLIFLLLPINEVLNSGVINVSFWSLYAVRVIWTSIMFIGIFKKPEWIKKILLIVFSLPFINRWKNKVEELTENLARASNDMGNRPFKFWFEAFGTTILTWSARFLVVNAIFAAFSSSGKNIIIFARQLVLWVVMALSPTPGGSGVAEYAFKEYYSDIFTSLSVILLVTLVWRLISYYLYLLFGVILIPSWVKKSFPKK